jgi:signal peptidase I
MLKYIVVSDSMSPLIAIGDELIIEPIEKDFIFNRFDIILFNSDRGLTCHYFWHENKNIDKGLIITRNLKNGRYDNPYDKKQIIGIVKNFKINFFLKLKILLRDLITK